MFANSKRTDVSKSFLLKSLFFSLFHDFLRFREERGIVKLFPDFILKRKLYRLTSFS